METFSALLAICAGNSPVIGEFPSQRPVTRSFDVFFDLRLNKHLSKQSWGGWFETLSRPLWRHSMTLSFARRFIVLRFVMDILWALNDPFDLSIHAIKIDMGRVMEVWLSCYLILLSVDSKTR